MTRYDVYNLYSALVSKEMTELKGVKFSYAMAKNTRLLKGEVESIDEMRKKESGEFDKERFELVKTYAEKDEQGNPVVKNNQYRLADTKTFTEELEKLREKFEIKAKEENFKKFMKEEIEVELFTVKQENIPEQISKGMSDAIFDLIEE